LAVLILALLLGGCASAPPSGPGMGQVGSPSDARRQALLQQADLLLGTPYRYGGADPRGFDCSGLVQFVHEAVGVPIPRTTLAQWRQARQVPLQQLRPGDLVFFRIDAGKGRHVGIYEGRGRFIHAPSAGKVVSRASLGNPYWRANLVGGATFL
jgi:cell wall-associated NlpC family hydrolase